MTFDRFVDRAALLAACLVVLCGCGGTNSAVDSSPLDAPRTEATGGDAFLLFPNPQEQGADGSPAINSLAYARAYYAAIDPSGSRDTLAKWKAANQFDEPIGQTATVVFSDLRDLGYGRRMTARRLSDKRLAVLVENYSAGGYDSPTLNLQAAASATERWRLVYNAIEFGPRIDGVPATPDSRSFARFYSFDARTGERMLEVDLDGRGNKAMPGACLNCHGGRGDALVRDSAGSAWRMRVAGDSKSGADGDVQGKLHPLEVSTFGFVDLPSFRRSDQEAAFKQINQWVLSTYPLPGGAPAAAEDANRPVASLNEWQATTAAKLIKDAYGGAGLPNARYEEPVDVPAAWTGGRELYRDVVVPHCRACHMVRGAGATGGDAIEFSTLSAFSAYRTQHKSLVYDRGTMPAAKIVYDRFVASSAPRALSNFLAGLGVVATDSAGGLLSPGRPVADVGVDLKVQVNQPQRLSGRGSRFVSRFRWTIESGASSASLTGADTATPTFVANAAGVYQLKLTVQDEAGRSSEKILNITVDATAYAGAPNFADIKKLWDADCGACHQGDFLSGEGPALRVPNAVNDRLLYDELRGRINFTDPANSKLLTKPAGLGHGASTPIRTILAEPADMPFAGLTWGDVLRNWVVSGAPY